MKIEIDCGKTKHGQDVKVIAFQEPSGMWLYDIVKLPENQRDDKVTIHNITGPTMAAIARAFEKIKAMDE